MSVKEAAYQTQEKEDGTAISVDWNERIECEHRFSYVLKNEVLSIVQYKLFR